MPHDQWKSNPYVVRPFEAFVPPRDLGLPPRSKTKRRSHPVYLSIRWRELLDANPALTTANLAEDQGVSPGRIRQILRLSSLAPEITAELQEMPSDRLKYFGEARLRKLIPLPLKEQIKRFEEMKEDETKR